MVTRKVIIDQLKKIDFNYKGWGRSEISELPNIILPDEEIYECVNGIYDGGFALIVATNVRVLLVDKKPLKFLTVEDMRFDMISELDYSNRLIGADINISSGGKSLRFRSYNQVKLRKLIGHVQHCMAEAKQKQASHQEGQVQHLDQINKQLQAYLLAQQQYQNQITNALMQQRQAETQPIPEPPKPSNELSDYLYAQSLLARHQQEHNLEIPLQELQTVSQEEPSIAAQDGDVQKVFANSVNSTTQVNDGKKQGSQFSQVINPLEIAISKLPQALKIKRFSQSIQDSSAE